MAENEVWENIGTGEQVRVVERSKDRLTYAPANGAGEPQQAVPVVFEAQYRKVSE